EAAPVVEDALATIRNELALGAAGVRVDFAVDEENVHFCAQKRRKDGPGPRAIALENYRLLNVIPEARTPLSGRASLSSNDVASAPAPFNRLREIEYSLNHPGRGELAAESWLFYLEVDDAKAFVRELSVPNARKIGRYVGSKQASELGAEVFDGIAERRRQFQQSTGRGGLFAPVDPQTAANRGAALGALIGGLVGESAAEREATKEYNYRGCRMYIMDLETYARQSALMKAEARGQIPQKEPGANSGRFFNRMADVVAGLQSGELEDALRDSVLAASYENERFIDPTPLFARRMLAVMLDDRHLLLGLSAPERLDQAIMNWRQTYDPQWNPKAPSQPWRRQTPGDVEFERRLKEMFARAPQGERFNLVGAARISPIDVKYAVDWLRAYYFPTLPFADAEALPNDTPQIFVLRGTDERRELIRGIVPNKAIGNSVHSLSGGSTLFDLIVSAKGAANGSGEDAESEIDFEFDDE
ncbi:MAG: hypothetical protein HUK22_03500, partial [Thermoguttaceae bacterium]|nr:hypothetical protein [Thermoguttaceae bacterium]